MEKLYMYISLNRKLKYWLSYRVFAKGGWLVLVNVDFYLVLGSLQTLEGEHLTRRNFGHPHIFRTERIVE